MHRFYAPSLNAGDETVALPREEGEHLTRVLRLGPGDTVGVFDGRGHEFLARVASPDHRDVRVQILTRVDPTPEPAVGITLAQAILKGEKMDDIVRDAVMMGVAAIQPLVTRRTEVTVAALARAGRVERWRRVALASVKQSRRAVLPEVRGPLTFENWLDEPRSDLSLMLVEPSAATDAGSLSFARDIPIPQTTSIAIGPEGGWTEGEWQAARARGMRLVTLGPRTLRADAAPVAALSVLLFLWGEL